MKLYKVIFVLSIFLFGCEENVLIAEHKKLEKVWQVDAIKSKGVNNLKEWSGITFTSCTPSSKQAKKGNYTCEANITAIETGLSLIYNLTKDGEINITFLKNSNLNSGMTIISSSSFQNTFFQSVRGTWKYSITSEGMIWSQGSKELVFK